MNTESRVRILDDVVVNQIAAGEVVERPASVVKELLENSLDAGATDITVAIDNGGRTKVEVVDDGLGMSKEDALLAIERFGTSKIKETADLASIESLGFRGEAIPSIAAVSRFSLSTHSREAEGLPGVELLIEGGRLREVTEMQMPPGTRATVRQLFYNVPARRKFLRAERTESGYIRSLVSDFAIAYPHCRFRLVSDGSEVLSFHSVSDFFQRARQLRLAGKDPLVLDEELGTPLGLVRLQGLLCRPEAAVSGSGKLRLIVNGRVVRDGVLLKAIRDGYGTFLKPGRYPAGVLKLEIPVSEVDVNVHPQKTEIRFRDASAVFVGVSRAVKSALSVVEPLVSKPVSGAAVDSSPSFSRRENQMGLVEFSDGWSDESSSQEGEVSVGGASRHRQSEHQASNKLTSFRFVGQIFSCYLLLEGDNTFVVLDMHAAHERVTFVRIKEQTVAGRISSQALLMPEAIDLPPERIEQFEKFRLGLEQMGFDCELFGEGSIVVRAVPAILAGTSAKVIFDDLMALPEWYDWKSQIDERWDQVISRLACHGSVRSGRELEREEVYRLLESLEEAEASAFCPHGRPVLREISLNELETMFGRTS